MAYKTMPDLSGLFATEIPKIGEAWKEAREEGELKTALADLKSDNPAELRKKAAQLFSKATTKSMAAAVQLSNMALAREQQGLAQATLAHRISEDIRNRGTPGGIALPPIGGGEAPVPAAPSGRFGIQRDMGVIPTDKTLLPGAPTAPSPGPQAEAPISEMSAAARTPEVPLQQQPPSDLPQVGQQQNVAPPPMPPSMLSGPGLTMPGMGGEPQGVRPPPAPSLMSPEQAGARREAMQLQAIINNLPTAKKDSPGAKILMERFKDALKRAGDSSVPSGVREYQFKEEQRRAAGEDPRTLEQYEYRKTVREADLKEINETYKTARTNAASANDMLKSLDRVDQILANKDFTSGTSTGAWNNAISLFNMLGKKAADFGIVVRPWAAEQFAFLKDPAERQLKAAALGEELTGLKNRMVLAQFANKLGAGTSNRDVHLVDAIFPSLGNTPAANALMAQYVRHLAQNQVEAEKDMREYRMLAEKSGKFMSPEGLEDFLAKRRDARGGLKDIEDKANAILQEQSKLPMTAGSRGLTPPPSTGAPPPPPTFEQRFGKGWAPPNSFVKNAAGKLFRLLPGGRTVPVDETTEVRD